MLKKDHPLYSRWKMMRQRCNNPTFPKYKLYGARGIKICPAWDDFWQYVADMGDCPDGYTLERIDNDGNYTPENCRWASHTEQAANRRPRVDHKTLTLNGVTKTQAEWSRELGIGETTMSNRSRKGWSDEKILTTPVLTPSQASKRRKKHGNEKQLEAFGESHSLSEWARIYGISQPALWQRLDRGWPLEKALATTAKGRGRKHHKPKPVSAVL